MFIGPEPKSETGNETCLLDANQIFVPLYYAYFGVCCFAVIWMDGHYNYESPAFNTART